MQKTALLSSHDYVNQLTLTPAGNAKSTVLIKKIVNDIFIMNTNET